MSEALQSGHAPLIDATPAVAPQGRRARVHVLRRRIPEVPSRPRWQDHLHDLLEPLLFAATVVLAVVALGLWVSPPARANHQRDLQAAPIPAPTAAVPAQAG